jgi:hypothetical protein
MGEWGEQEMNSSYVSPALSHKRADADAPNLTAGDGNLRLTLCNVLIYKRKKPPKRVASTN